MPKTTHSLQVRRRPSKKTTMIYKNVTVVSFDFPISSGVNRIRDLYPILFRERDHAHHHNQHEEGVDGKGEEDFEADHTWEIRTLGDRDAGNYKESSSTTACRRIKGGAKSKFLRRHNIPKSTMSRWRKKKKHRYLCPQMIK